MTLSHITSVLEGYLYQHLGRPLFSSCHHQEEEDDPCSIARVLCSWTLINASTIVPNHLGQRLRAIECGYNVIRDIAAAFSAADSEEDLESITTILIWLNKHVTMTSPQQLTQELTQVAQAFSPLFFESTEAGILLMAILVTHVHSILPNNKTQIIPCSTSTTRSSISPLALTSSAMSQGSQDSTSLLSPLPNPFASRQQQADVFARQEIYSQLWNYDELSVELRSLVNISVSSCLFDDAPDNHEVQEEVDAGLEPARLDSQSLKAARSSDEVICTISISIVPPPMRKDSI